MLSEGKRRKLRYFRVPGSHVFTPNRDDVINARLRLRYSSTCDTYYRDWSDSISLTSNNVMPGWEKGVYAFDSVNRNVDEEAGEVYFDRTNQSTTGNMKWKFDFSSCGLLVNELTIRLNYLDSHGGEITTTIVGNVGNKRIHYIKGGEYVKYTEFENSSEIIVVVHFIGDANQVTKLFPQTIMGGIGYPMDIKISLKQPFESLGRPRVLLGLMYSSAQEIQVDSRHYKETGCLEACRGFLHVHIYEGKDIPQQRGKTLETSAKCYLLPTTKKVKCKSVTKKGGSPVWNEQFLIVDVGYTEIKKQAFEFCLVSNHKNKKMVGGFRLSLGYRQIMANQEEKANAVISKMLLKPNDSSKHHKETPKNADLGCLLKEDRVARNGIHYAQINGNKIVEPSAKSVHPLVDTSKAWKVTSMDELRCLDRSVSSYASQQSLGCRSSNISKDNLTLCTDSTRNNDSLTNFTELESAILKDYPSCTKGDSPSSSYHRTNNPSRPNSLNINDIETIYGSRNPSPVSELLDNNSNKPWLYRNETSRHCRNSHIKNKEELNMFNDSCEKNNNHKEEIPRLRSRSTAHLPDEDHSAVSCSSALSRRWNSDRQIKKDKKKSHLEVILGEGLDEMTLDAVGLEVKQWENVVSRPKHWHYCWQLLRKDMIPVHQCS